MTNHIKPKQIRYISIVTNVVIQWDGCYCESFIFKDIFLPKGPHFETCVAEY